VRECQIKCNTYVAGKVLDSPTTGDIIGATVKAAIKGLGAVGGTGESTGDEKRKDAADH
jgi:hypothetical protein